MTNLAIFKRIPNGVVVKDGVNADAEAHPDVPVTQHPAVESEAAFDYLTGVDAQVSDQTEIFKRKLKVFVAGFLESIKELPRAVEGEVASLIPGIILEEFTLGEDLQASTAMYAQHEKVGGVMDILVEEGKAKKVSPQVARLMSMAAMFGAPPSVIDSIANLDGPCNDPLCPVHGKPKTLIEDETAVYGEPGFNNLPVFGVEDLTAKVY